MEFFIHSYRYSTFKIFDLKRPITLAYRKPQLVEAKAIHTNPVPAILTLAVLSAAVYLKNLRSDDHEILTVPRPTRLF